MKCFLGSAARVLLAVLPALVVYAGGIYTITDLGSLGGEYATAFALNQQGEAVGAATDNRGYLHALRFDPYGITSLSTNQAAAFGINNAGTVSGTEYVNGQTYATVWQNGSSQHVAGAGSYGIGINELGDVTGMFVATDGMGHAFVTRNGLLEDLGLLPGGSWSAAYGINSLGEAAGYGMANGMFRGMVWSPEGSETTLGTFGGNNSYAMGLNDEGQVVGQAQIINGYLHAFLWNDGVMQDLGTLGGTSSYAYGINNAGSVVGYSWLAGAGGTHAYLYMGGFMFDLNDLVDAGSGWTLEQAYAINDAGQIAGSGLLNGVEHAFRLDLDLVQPLGASAEMVDVNSMADAPEPQSWLLALGGLAALVVRGRSRRLVS